MSHGMIRFIATLFLACLSLMAQGVEVVTYYHNDALGSPIIATDQEGRVVWRKSYAPYGQPIGQTAPDEPGYTGKFEEPDLGIQDFGARWYDPGIGRFLAIDPAGFDPQNPQSFNRYAYANNNPYKYVDPDGRVPLLLPVIVGIGLELGNLAWEAYDNGANPCGDCVRSSGVSIPGAGALGRTIAKTADNAAALAQGVPGRLARVAPAEFGSGPRLAAPGSSEAFVTAADDIAGITNSRALAERLTLVDDAGELIPGPRAVIEFDTPASGIASPISRTNPGFAGRGKTRGGAREFTMPNAKVDELSNVSSRIVE